MSLQVVIRPVEGGTAVVVLEGPLTLGESLDKADAQLQQAIESGTRWLVVDMRGVPYMDSAGLSMLVHAFVTAQKSGGDLGLSGLTSRVVNVLRVTRVFSLLHIFPDEESALAGLKR